MMLQEPYESPYDFHLTVFGFRTRVTWGFWIAAVVLGWDWARSIDAQFFSLGLDSPGAAAILLIWTAAILISIFVHELGHALAMRYYGTDSRIVLYHFGGLAIPESFGSWNAARRRNLDPRASIIISAAGPAAQILLGLIVFIIGRGVGMDMQLDGWLHYYFRTELPDIELPTSAATYAAFNALVTPSIFWAIFNLVPILPLDGGNILLNILLLRRGRDPYRNAYFVSMIAAAVLGLYFMNSGDPMMGLMCLSLAASNWQMLQSMTGNF